MGIVIDIAAGRAIRARRLAEAARPRRQRTRRPVATAGIEPMAVSVAEAARLMAVSQRHVYDLMAGAYLPYYKSGRLRRIPLQAIRDFIAGCGTEAID